jgi:DUF1365 family protein
MSAPYPPAHSALYEGRVTHHRLEPTAHTFTSHLALCYLDLEEIPAVLEQHSMWSLRPGRPVQFRRSDYLGDPAVPLLDAVRETAGCDGPVRMLAHVRTWGWCFNPLALYFCFDPAGLRVRRVVASVTNTPWNERHDYVLDADPDGRVDVEVAKAMHVSPFFPMEQTYRFRIGIPGEGLGVSVENVEDGRAVFGAGLRLRRRPLDHRAMGSLLVRHPLMTWRVSAGIYWQAARLAAKGVPVHRHPGRAVPGGCPVGSREAG